MNNLRLVHLFRSFTIRSVCACLVLTSAAKALAVVPADHIVSPNSRGFVSVPDVDLLYNNWQQTQMGQLVQDDAMRPFIEDMKQQWERRASGVKLKLGLELSDLRDVASGELGMALVEMPQGPAALAVAIDTTGRQRELAAVLERLDRNLVGQGATKQESEYLGTPLTIYDIPPQGEGNLSRQTIYFTFNNQFVASDNLRELQEMRRRIDERSGGLSEVIPYQQTMVRCRNEAGELEPELRWFVDPFGYARAMRSLDPPGTKRRGKDYVRLLKEQGFDAIQGIGGFVNLAVGGAFEVLSRTAVFAPPLPDEPEGYRLAMRMMKFPNTEDLAPSPWIPRKLATYRTISFDMAYAFQYFGTLFDAIAGYEEAFEGVLEGLEKDPYGPQVDVERDFVAHLGERIVLVTDYELPITTKSERFLFVVELKNEAGIAATVEKFMDSDPNAVPTEHEGRVVWEIHEAESDIPELDIAVADLDLLLEPEDRDADGLAVERDLPTSGVCVTDGHLFIASHVEFLKEILSRGPADQHIGDAGDYREVESVLAGLLPGPRAAKFFVRTDEACRSTYELLRQGRMPEAETLLGRALNRLLTPNEADEEHLLREQKIDGRQLPEFEMVRRYFGPTGTAVRSDGDGWFIVGAALSKTLPQARASSNVSSERSTVR